MTIGNGSSPVDNGTLGTWNTTDNGLYTIQLTAVDNSGAPHTSTVQVTIDNKPPTVDIINPWQDKQYLMEDDEWVSIDANAQDNLSMGHVDFILDNNLIGSSKVAPFSFKWNITMSDALAAGLASNSQVGLTYASTDDAGNVVTNTVTVPVTRKSGRAIATFPNGLSAIRDTGGYTETHTVKVRAYDAAGNMTESESVRFLVSHVKARPTPAALLRPFENPLLFVLNELEWFNQEEIEILDRKM